MQFSGCQKGYEMLQSKENRKIHLAEILQDISIDKGNK